MLFQTADTLRCNHPFGVIGRQSRKTQSNQRLFHFSDGLSINAQLTGNRIRHRAADNPLALFKQL